MAKFKVGTKVKINSNSYGDEVSNSGTGEVKSYEPCNNGGNKACDCGAGGTYFVKVEGLPYVRAYVGVELTEI